MALNYLSAANMLVLQRRSDSILTCISASSRSSTPSESEDVSWTLSQKADGDTAMMFDENDRDGNQLTRFQDHNPRDVLTMLLLRESPAACKGIGEVTAFDKHRVSDRPDYIVRLGQIVADQTVRYNDCFGDRSRCGRNGGAALVASEVVKAVLPRSENLYVEQCTALKTPLNHSPLRIGRQHSYILPSGKVVTAPGSRFRMEMPRFRANRGTRTLDLSLHALSFWEELGLSPSRGQKNVTAFFLCPATDGMRRGAGLFMDAIGSTYASLRLGSHSSGSAAVKGHHNGVVALPLSKEDDSGICDKFGKSNAALLGWLTFQAVYCRLSRHMILQSLFT